LYLFILQAVVKDVWQNEHNYEQHSTSLIHGETWYFTVSSWKYAKIHGQFTDGVSEIRENLTGHISVL